MSRIMKNCLRSFLPGTIETSCTATGEGLYYLYSENKGADQLCGYHEADQRLCFSICKKSRFSHNKAHINKLYRPRKTAKGLKCRIKKDLFNLMLYVPVNSFGHLQFCGTLSEIPNTSEPRPEKTCLCMCKNEDADQLCSNCAADQHLCFCYIDGTFPLLPKSKISSLKLFVAVHSSLCLT